MNGSKGKDRGSRHLPWKTVNISELVIFLSFIILQLLTSIVVSSSEVFGSASEVQVSDSKTWIISKDLCTGFPYCLCNEDTEKINIVCSCNESASKTATNEVVHLKKASDSPDKLTKNVSLKIQKCSNLTIAGGAFSTLAVKVEVIIDFVQHAELHDNAFGDLGLGSVVTFKDVRIPVIPPKSFPSTIDKVEFINSEVDTISTNAFWANRFNTIKMVNSTIRDFDSNAFSENTQIEYLAVSNSKFYSIKSHAIASGTDSMSWVDSWIGQLHGWSMSGTIPNISFLRNTIGVVQTNGMTFKQWTWVTLVNNTFKYVNVSGIDLTNHATTYNITEINGNHWLKVAPDFIVVGKSDSPLALVMHNTFEHPCDCNRSFLSEISLHESHPWLYEKLKNTSHCTATEKGAVCLGQNTKFVSYDQWKEFCSTPTFLCLNDLTEVSDVSYAPTLTSSRLRILVIFIGASAITIVACLVAVLCIYSCRSREPRTSKLNGCATKQENCSPPHSYVDLMPSKVPQVSSIRPRSMLIEDVEMEDKCVQTMPSELSTDVLEELRGKLSHPDSFWDAKETIDHLYDLIQVKPHNTSSKALSSPPDVTMCNIGNPSSKVNKSTNPKDSTKPLPLPRYAQIKGKPKIAPICEYGDPSDSQMHVYSELSLAFPQNTNQTQTTVTNPQDIETKKGRPVLCEYTEPKDVHPHVYSELGNSANIAVIPYHQSLQRSSGQCPAQEPNFLSLNTASTQMRPLPSIPSTSSLVL